MNRNWSNGGLALPFRWIYGLRVGLGSQAFHHEINEERLRVQGISSKAYESCDPPTADPADPADLLSQEMRLWIDISQHGSSPLSIKRWTLANIWVRFYSSHIRSLRSSGKTIGYGFLSLPVPACEKTWVYAGRQDCRAPMSRYKAVKVP